MYTCILYYTRLLGKGSSRTVRISCNVLNINSLGAVVKIDAG